MRTKESRLEVVRRQVRTGHQRLYELQGDAIEDLREALEAVSRTHDAMLQLFHAGDTLDDVIGESSESDES